MGNRALVILFFTVLTVFSLYTHAQVTGNNAANYSYDCTDVNLDTVDDSLLTKEERIAKMDGTLQGSMDSYSACIQRKQENMAAQAGGGGGGQGASGSSSGEGSQTESSSESQAQNAVQQVSQEQKIIEETATSARQYGNRSQRINQERVEPKDNNAIICQLLKDEIKTAKGDKRAGFEKQYADYNCR